MMRQSQRLAVSLRVHHPPVSRDSLLEASTLLVAEKYGRPAVPRADTADQGGVVRGQPVAVKLDEVGGKAADVVERVGAIGVPRELDDLPYAHEYISRRWASSGLSSVRGTTMST